MNLTSLQHSLSRLAGACRPGVLLSSAGQYVSAGLEALPAGAAYHWDGLRRRVDPAHPFVVFQYTLAGWGIYEEGGVARRAAPGNAFVAYVPSAHVYRLPADAPGWTYFWVMFNHPYAVARMRQAAVTGGGVTALDPDSPVVARMARLFEGVCQGGFRDGWAQEAALFEFLWEYERHEQGRRFAPPERERLLDDVRREVIAVLETAPDVARLARTRGMSRSRFSHHFKAVTGLPPARFVAQVRLEEVARLLLETDMPLKDLASAIGFADANHLCKVFRRHYHLSPGVFRGQMR